MAEPEPGKPSSFQLQETTMEIKTVIIIMFVVFCLFVLANWLNRPRK
jgi:type III secretory pathway component EscS